MALIDPIDRTCATHGETTFDRPIPGADHECTECMDIFNREVDEAYNRLAKGRLTEAQYHAELETIETKFLTANPKD